MQTDKAHFMDLFRYDDWANRRVLNAVTGAALPPEAGERILLLLSHLLRARAVWLGRIQGTEAAHLPIWERDAPEVSIARAEADTQAWMAFLDGCTPEHFVEAVSYANSRGERFSSTLREIATHVVNHGTYHRAQIALLLREAGAEPPATDYILYARSERT